MKEAEETHGEWWPILPGGIKKDLQVTLTLGLENQGPVCQASREQRI